MRVEILGSGERDRVHIFSVVDKSDNAKEEGLRKGTENVERTPDWCLEYVKQSIST